MMFVLTRLSTEEAIIKIKVSVLLDGSAAVEVRSDRFMLPMLGRMLRNGAMGEGNVIQNQLSHLPNKLKKLLDK